MKGAYVHGKNLIFLLPSAFAVGSIGCKLKIPVGTLIVSLLTVGLVRIVIKHEGGLTSPLLILYLEH
jgi:uncharacterized membrane protein AbrB (regulator of aidB expression)